MECWDGGRCGVDPTGYTHELCPPIGVPDAAEAAKYTGVQDYGDYNEGVTPYFYDPDEPLFVIKAVELLTDGTLNPRWFGHPGTTTIYLTSLTSLAVIGWGFVVGDQSGEGLHASSIIL